jgi:NADPH:quinone reductase
VTPTRPHPATIDLDTLAHRRLTIRGDSFGAPDELADLLVEAGRALLPAIAAGRIKPVIDSVLPFDQATEAAERVREGLSTGKVILAAVRCGDPEHPDAVPSGGCIQRR